MYSPTKGKLSVLASSELATMQSGIKSVNYEFIHLLEKHA